MTDLPDRSTRAPRIVFLNRFYWPEEPATAQLLTDLAEGLAARGHEVIVIARRTRNQKMPRTETRHGVKILRVTTTNWTGKARLAGKALDFISFFGAFLRAFSTVRCGDTLVALTDPPLLGIGAAWIARWRGARLFHWVQDIYPEIAIELVGQRWLALFRPWRDAAWRDAEACVTLGEDMAAVVADADVPPEKISLVPNWAPAGLFPPAAEEIAELRGEWTLSGKFVIAYSGNLGRVHHLAPLLEVAEALRDDPEIVFVFIGGGARRPALEDEARRRGLTNIIFRPAQPRALLSRSLALGDVHLVTLRPGCERYVFPSKLYGIAAVGRPVIFIGPRSCELARIVEENKFGAAFAPDEMPALAVQLRALKRDAEKRNRLGNAAADWAARSGGATAAIERWDTLLRTSRGLATASAHA
jgi:colanic acid biosynthesis glycosyl transferase WcaI